MFLAHSRTFVYYVPHVNDVSEVIYDAAFSVLADLLFLGFSLSFPVQHV